MRVRNSWLLGLGLGVVLPTATAAQTDGAVKVGTGVIVSVRSGLEAIAAFQPRVEPVFLGGECLVREDLPMAARIVSIHYPSRAETATSISLWFDDTGALIRYIETSGPRPAPNADLLAAIAEANRLPKTTIQLDVPQDRALAMNSGGDEPAAGVTGSIDQFDASPPFRYLRERVMAVRLACLAGTTAD
jgi:hypothetical protein